MQFPRAGGVLLHPSSLPGPYGIGDLGPAARRFLDFLERAGMQLWQVLPLGPPGAGASPYAGFSAFAGNPYLIAVEPLLEKGWLHPEDVEPLTSLPADTVAYDELFTRKDQVLRTAFARFGERGTDQDREAFWAFCQHPDVSSWLEDYALFMAIKVDQGNRPWIEWPAELARREPAAMRRTVARLEDELWYQRFLQWTFEDQWQALKAYAHARGIEIIGDIPIYVADDSADVWSHPELFHLDEAGNRTVVAGVPPDYFSKTGQLWGNPLYRWDVLERTGFQWWIDRVRVTLSRVDRVRIDHFRGFAAYWAIPAGEETAVGGRWIPGPGHALFEALEARLGSLPIIAEDLGIITPDVERLREDFGFPGMKVLQFAFGGGADNAYLPHNYERNCVVFTGTHDNDTTRGWLDAVEETVLRAVLDYVGEGSESLVWRLIRLAMASVAAQCIVPMQDFLELGTEARMNVPGTTEGNWRWRMAEDAATPELAARIRKLAVTYGRARPERQPNG